MDNQSNAENKNEKGMRSKMQVTTQKPFNYMKKQQKRMNHLQSTILGDAIIMAMVQSKTMTPLYNNF